MSVDCSSREGCTSAWEKDVVADVDVCFQPLARDRFWNLSKNWTCLSHQFVTLRNGFKFHYLSNNRPETLSANSKKKPVVIFLHGFPDSWAIWRHILTSSEILEGSTVIAPDLPGYGGTDSLPRYGATEVLEVLTEFIIAVRERYGVDGTQASQPEKQVVIVAHDWGAVLAFRLAAEAPQLADRVIVTNGILVWNDFLAEFSYMNLPLTDNTWLG